MPTVFVDSRPPSPLLRSPPRRQQAEAPLPSMRHHYSAAAVPSAAAAPRSASHTSAPSTHHSARASPDRHISDRRSSVGNSPGRLWAPAMMPQGPAAGYPGYPYQLPAGFMPYPMMAPMFQQPDVQHSQHAPSAPHSARGASAAASAPAEPSAASPPRREPVEPVDVELTARLEAKQKEIDSLKAQNGALKTALSQTKSTFDENVAQLRECQAECRKLEEFVVERDAKLRELEEYRAATADRVEHVDALIKREKEHCTRVTDDLRRQLQAVVDERTALETRLSTAQEENDRCRHDAQVQRRQIQHEVAVAQQKTRAEMELEFEEKARNARAKVDEKEGALRHLDNDLLTARGEIMRERERADGLKARVDDALADGIALQHKLQQAQLSLEEVRQAREADVAALRREIEGLRATRDELQRASQGQVLSVSQESAKRSHEVELLHQQVSAAKSHAEAEVRRHRTELDDTTRAFEAKMRGVQEDARNFERQLRASEDASDRLRRQLADERGARDHADSERDALTDKVVALQRTVTKRDAEIQRLQQQLGATETAATERLKEAEVLQSELDLHQAREKKELALALEARTKEFRSVSRMRSQASHMAPEGQDVSALRSRFDAVSNSFVGAAVDASHGLAPEATMRHEASFADDHRQDGTPQRPPPFPRQHASILRSPAPLGNNQDVGGMTPIAAAHDASNVAMATMQRVLERQLAAERDRSEELQRRLSETSISAAVQRESDRTSMMDSDMRRSINAAEAAVARARAETSQARTRSPERVQPSGTSVAAPSPRAERLRQVSETLKDLRVSK